MQKIKRCENCKHLDYKPQEYVKCKLNGKNVGLMNSLICWEKNKLLSEVKV